MRAIQCSLTSDGQADPVYRDWKAFRQVPQLRQRATPFAHVVLGVNFQPLHGGWIFQNIFEMLGLIANTGTGRQAFGGASNMACPLAKEAPLPCGRGGFGLARHVAIKFFKAAHATFWQFHRGAGARRNQRPGIALIVYF